VHEVKHRLAGAVPVHVPLLRDDDRQGTVDEGHAGDRTVARAVAAFDPGERGETCPNTLDLALVGA
jgi:hypothetical protein